MKRPIDIEYVLVFVFDIIDIEFVLVFVFDMRTLHDHIVCHSVFVT